MRLILVGEECHQNEKLKEAAEVLTDMFHINCAYHSNIIPTVRRHFCGFLVVISHNQAFNQT